MQIGNLTIHNGDEIPSAPPKDADSWVWYGFEYTLRPGEVIQSSSWLIDNVPVQPGDTVNGLQLSDEDRQGFVTEALLKQGIRGREYILTNQFSTNMTPRDHRSAYILVTDL